jgi:putative sigma-54 modulation protein
MNIRMTGRHMTVTPALEEHAKRKLMKLRRYFDHIIDAHVVASVLRNWHVVEITLSANGVLLRAEERSEDMYQSIDQAVEKLERQLKRHKDRLHSHSRGVVRTEVAPLPEEEGEQQIEEEAPQQLPPIVRTKTLAVKPMSPEEAALQMELLGHDFFVFRNAETEQFNVVYRRREGNYGLIELED